VLVIAVAVTPLTSTAAASTHAISVHQRRDGSSHRRRL